MKVALGFESGSAALAIEIFCLLQLQFRKQRKVVAAVVTYRVRLMSGG